MNDSTPHASRRRPRLLVSLGLGLVVWLGGTHASANPSEAQAVFDKGVADMLAGRFDTACLDIEKSYRLEPLPGVMFTLAECFAAAGKTASALSRYADFRTLLTTLPSERRLTFDERERLAVSRSDELARLVPDLRISVSGPTAAQVVTVNGDVLEPASFGVPHRLDPGAYVVRAEAPGYQSWERTITVENEQHRKLVVPPLAPLRPTAPKSAPGSTGGTGTASPPTWVYASGGAGLAGLLLGASFGAIALSRKGEVDSHCPGNACDATGREALDSGRSAATVSNIGFGVGVLGLSGAAVGWLLSRSSNEREHRVGWWVPRLVVAPKAGQLAFAGDFE